MTALVFLLAGLAFGALLGVTVTLSARSPKDIL
jgi:hypothetical protein